MKILNNRFPSFLWLGLSCAMAVHGLDGVANAATLVDQDFDLADGSLVGASNGAWQHRSGEEGDLVTEEGSLIIRSSASEDVAVAIGESDYDESSSETLFVSFTLQVVDLPTAGGGYFAHFRSGGSSTFRGRLFIAASDDGGYQLGVSNGASKFVDSVAFPTALEAGKSYRIVMSYEPSVAVTRLGIDPDQESDLTAVATDSVSVKSINQFAIRQSSGIGTIQIDHLKISTEFSDLSASAEIQEPTLRMHSNDKVLPERGEPSLIVRMERRGPLDGVLDLELIWGGTAEFGLDYRGAPELISFLPDQAFAEIQCKLVNDALKEGTETIEMTVQVSDKVRMLGLNPLIWEILDDDLTTVEISTPTVTVTEGVDGFIEINLYRTGDLSLPLQVDWMLEGHTEKGVDFDASFPFSVSFSSGQEHLTHKLALLDDSVPEMPEWFQLRLHPSERYQIKNNQISVEILNDDFEGMLLSESFDYQSGPVTNVSSGKWKHTSGSSDELNVFEGQLDLNETQSEDIMIDIPVSGSVETISNTAYEVFVGMDLFVAKAPQGEGNYWAHFRGNTSSTFKGRLFSRAVNPAEGTFEFGISNGQSTGDIWFPQVFVAPVSLRLILGFTPGQSLTRLWIDPDSFQTAHIVAQDETTSSNINGFSFRQPASRSSGMGRILINHLTISTEWEDVIVGSEKPYVFWQFDKSSRDLSEFFNGIDMITTAIAAGPESLLPSEHLRIHRLGYEERELWVNFTLQGNVTLNQDLFILQGQGPVLIQKEATTGILNLAPIEDELEEPDETMVLSLMPHDSYQIAYPNQARFILLDSTVMPPPDGTALNISMFSARINDQMSIGLKLEGHPGQSYLIEFAEDLNEWQTWKADTLERNVETFILNEWFNDHTNLFFQVSSGQP